MLKREGTICKMIVCKIQMQWQDDCLQDKDMNIVCKSMRCSLVNLNDIWMNIVCKGMKYMLVRSYKRKERKN